MLNCLMFGERAQIRDGEMERWSRGAGEGEQYIPTEGKRERETERGMRRRGGRQTERNGRR